MRPSWILKFYMYFMYLYHSAIGDSIICDHMVIGMQLKNKKYINPISQYELNIQFLF